MAIIRAHWNWFNVPWRLPIFYQITQCGWGSTSKLRPLARAIIVLSKKEPLFVPGLSDFLFFQELQNLRPPTRKKNGWKLWAGPPTEECQRDSQACGGRLVLLNVSMQEFFFCFEAPSLLKIRRKWIFFSCTPCTQAYVACRDLPYKLCTTSVQPPYSWCGWVVDRCCW